MRHLNLEVNTDLSLLDFRLNFGWEDFTELHNHQYGLAIDYIKNVVTGVSYDNNVMNLVVGEGGFYTQSKNFPVAFYGDTGEARVRYLNEAEARAFAWEMMNLYRIRDAQSLTCLYSDTSPLDVFFGYRVDKFSDEQRSELGELRHNLPLHLRIIVEAKDPENWESEWLETPKGVLIYQRTLQGQHVLVTAPGRRQLASLVNGFGE